MAEIGSLANSDTDLHTQRQKVWTGDPINILCVAITPPIYIGRDFYLNYLCMLQKVLKPWETRTTTSTTSLETSSTSGQVI